MPGETANFGLEQLLDHSVRYRRASEYVEVVKGLLDSWDDDAFPRDQESGIYADPTKLHRLDHEGEFFKVAGPLNISRSPQGYPVFAQAGSSPDGQAFAAEVAEMMFTFQSNIERAREFSAVMKNLTADAGRNPDELKILPALELVVEETDEQAQDKLDELNDLVDPAIALNLLSQALYFDLSSYPLDGPLPDIPQGTEQAQTRQRFLIEEARRDGLTIRQLARRLGTGDSGAIAGSPVTIADRIEEWVGSDACDGFNLTFPNPLRSLTNFVDLVVPELQRRGIFHEDYTGTTLRENLGLPRPARGAVAGG
jgi:FMN-dependent oxidoreductase (nitrilotriacetate monooxygenase family)